MLSFIRKPTAGEILAAIVGAAVVAIFYNKDSIMSALPSSSEKSTDTSTEQTDVVIDV